jgi:hypothetical protein
MDQGRELPARETSGHAAPMFAQRSPQGQAVQMSQGMLVSQGGNGIEIEVPIDEVVLVYLRLCVGEKCFFMSVCCQKCVLYGI